MNRFERTALAAQSDYTGWLGKIEFVLVLFPDIPRRASLSTCTLV